MLISLSRVRFGFGRFENLNEDDNRYGTHSHFLLLSVDENK